MRISAFFGTVYHNIIKQCPGKDFVRVSSELTAPGGRRSLGRTVEGGWSDLLKVKRGTGEVTEGKGRRRR